MPDSFTKFKEDPIKKGSNVDGPNTDGGGGDDDDDDDDDTPVGPCPPGSEITTGNCLTPVSLVMTTSSANYQLDEFTFGKDITPIEARALKSTGPIDPQNPANWLNFFTFTISPSILPPGFSFNVNTGVISGSPIAFFPKTIYTISAVYTGLNPVTLTGAAAATVELSVSTYIKSPVKIRPPTGHFLIVKLSNVTPFATGDQIAFETGGSGNIVYVDEISKEVHVQADNSIVPLITYFDQGAEAGPPNIVAVDNNASFVAPVATVEDFYLALDPSVTLPTNSALTGAFYFLPTSDIVPTAPNSMAISAAEIDSFTFSLTPSLPAGLSFNQKKCSVNCGGFPCSTQPLCLGAGGVWSAIRPGLISGTTAVNLQPTTYTVSARNIAGELVNSTFKLSSLSFPNPKSIELIAYKQKPGQRLRLTLNSVAPFSVGQNLTTEDGGLAEINFIDSASNTMFITILAGHEEYARFTNGLGVDNNSVFFNSKAQITSQPVYLYQNTGNLNNVTQQRMDIAVAPLDYFENAANIAEDRTITYSITPQITNVPGIRFQVRSGCTNLTTGAVNAAILTPAACVAGGFAWIRGGTMWGDPDPLKPLNQTAFTITATTLRGQQTSTTVNLEFTATQAPIEFSLSQNVLLEVPSVGGAFAVGDFISSNQGGGNNGLGTVRAVIPAQAGSPNEYLWVNVTSGIFAVNNNIDNMKKYAKQQTYILRVIPVNASLQFASTAGFVDSLVDGSSANQITSATGTARVILNDEVNNRLYVRVSDGYFQTNQAISGNTLTQINSQNITMVINSAVPAGVTKDFDIVQGADVNSYNASGVIRNISGTTLEVETLSNRFEVGGGNLYFTNPSSGATRTVSAVRTNNRRFLALKNKAFRLYPTLEAGSNNVGYTISPPLPPGLALDPLTGAITGIPEDRSAATVYTITVSNEFTSPVSSISYPITLEVKDYLELSVTTNANSYILHQGGMGKNRAECLITRDQLQATSTVPRDIFCLLDGGEFDIFQKGVSLKLDIAPDMCEYVDFKPYNFATHPAAATTNANYAPGNNPLIRHTGDNNDPACTAAFGGGITTEFPVSTNFNPLMGITDVSDFSHYCGYNYTIARAIDPGPNCDPGQLNTRTFTYNVSQQYLCVPQPGLNQANCDNQYGVCSGGGHTNAGDCISNGEEWTPDPANEGSIDVCSRTQANNTLECGGELYNCLSGPGVDYVDPKLLFEDAVADTKQTQPGLSTELLYPLKAPSTEGYFSNASIVNFQSANSCVSASNYNYHFAAWENFATNRRATAIMTENITTPIVGSQFYTFNCLNGSKETLARVRLVIRDWDRAFKASNNIDQMLPAGSLMKGGVYDVDVDGFGEFINKYTNWDDIRLTFDVPPAAPNYSCPVAGPVVETQRFPFPLDNL